MKCEVSWHHGWSKHYYYKKHYGLFYSLLLNIPFAFQNFLKWIIFSILKIKKNQKFTNYTLKVF